MSVDRASIERASVDRLSADTTPVAGGKTSHTAQTIPVAVFGGTGYVAGELLRLLASHPRFRVGAVFSHGQPGTTIGEAFPHLMGTPLGDIRFRSEEDCGEWLDRTPRAGGFLATPHGETAALADRVLGSSERAGADLRLVDLSADFRLPSPELYEAVYRKPHGAPARLARFVCAVPEMNSSVDVLSATESGPATPPDSICHAAHPGCFTTAVTLAAWPFLSMGLVEPAVFASAVTGSSGSGRTPVAGTHHPERAHNMYAYQPLAHRHEAEMRMLLSRAAGCAVEVDFIPHSGPFVRGIHATVRMSLREELRPEAVRELLAEFLRGHRFVESAAQPPRLTEVVGTNRSRMFPVVRGRTLVVLLVLDNLVKGAAGGAVQWMNRLWGFEESAGLDIPGLGWF